MAQATTAVFPVVASQGLFVEAFKTRFGALPSLKQFRDWKAETSRLREADLAAQKAEQARREAEEADIRFAEWRAAWAERGVERPSPEWPLPGAQGAVFFPKEEGHGRPSSFGDWLLSIEELPPQEIPSPDYRGCWEYRLSFPEGKETEFVLPVEGEQWPEVYGVYERQELGNLQISYVQEIIRIH